MEPPTKTTSTQVPLIAIIVAVIGILVTVGLGVYFIWMQGLAIDNSNDGNNTNNVEVDRPDSSEENTALIKNLPADLDLIPLTNETLGQYDQPYFDFGFQVEASSAAPARKNPQPTFIFPLGTKVKSLVDGTVVSVPKLYSNDYSIHVQTSDDSELIFETEHVINPTVKVGDKVKAGQEIAEVSDYDAHNYAGYGLVEIGILIGGTPPSHVCPFEYLDPESEDSIKAEMQEFYEKWNSFKGKTVYNTELAIPGCMSTDPIEG